MRFAINVLKSEKTTRQGKTSSYVQLELTYKRIDTGKIESKKLMSFANHPQVYQSLIEAKMDEQYLVTAEKNEGTGYWDWIEAIPQAPGASTPSTPNQAAPQNVPASTTVRSTYETAEERAKKQVYIIKQSCLAQAVAYVIGTKQKIESVSEITNLAQNFVDWVVTDKKVELTEMFDDVPD